MTVTQIETKASTRNASKVRDMMKGQSAPGKLTVPIPKALSESDAKALSSKITRKLTSTGKAVDDIGTMIREAHAGRIHEATGHDTFAAWLVETVGDRQLYVSKADKRTVAVWLSNDGMVSRDVAEFLDCSKSSIANWVRDAEGVAKNGQDEGEGSEPKPEPTADDIADQLAAAFNRATKGLSPEDAAAVRAKLHKLTGRSVKAMTGPAEGEQSKAA